jgi:hypothetical protein
VLAETDVSTRETPVFTGLYRLIPVTPDDLAKSGAWIVKITAVATAYEPTG